MQATHGEFLTSEHTIERMRLEAESRKSKVPKPKTAKRLAPESKSEAEDDVKCKFCPNWWASYKDKNGEQWLQCDLCDEYICPKCLPGDIDLEDDYNCKDCFV